MAPTARSGCTRSATILRGSAPRSLANPDFAKLAEAYGGWATRVDTTAGFAPALADAMGRTGVRLIHCITDVEVISNQTTIEKLRAS